MKPRATIFISGVTQEFAGFRDAVASEVHTKGCFADLQTDFAPDYRTVEEMLRRKLHDADAVIHIVGYRYGAEPNERPAHLPRSSYTQMEFAIAQELHKPVYVFLSQDSSVRDTTRAEEQAEDAEAIAMQIAHRQAVQGTNALYYFFRDGAELRKLVAQIPVVAAADFKADISRIDKYAPTDLIGREDELALLNNGWLKVRQAQTPRRHVIALVAMGGEGKTSLVAKWAAELAHNGWLGCDAVFAWSFYSQGTREQMAASSDLFLAEALRFFGDAEMAQSSQSAFVKAHRVAKLVAGRPTLLILDGLEPLQYAPTSPTPGELRDHAMSALLKALATNSQGLCVLTTRYPIADLRNYVNTTVLEHHLSRLSEGAGVQLLQSLGVLGGAPELASLVHDARGHALSLNLLGAYLREAHGGDVRKRDQVKLEEADAEEQGGHAFRVMDAYVQWIASPDKRAKEAKRGQRAIAVLRMMGLFDRPVSADCLHALLKAPAIRGLTDFFADITAEQRNIVYARLEAAKLLTVNRDVTGALLSLDAHPLVREYFGKALKEQQPQAWREAHGRIYEHLCTTTKEGKQPTLQGLQPLYQAVAHGCQAGMQQKAFEDVYYARIQRKEAFWSIKSLGAYGADLGAITSFFESAWDSLPPSLALNLQAALLNSAANNLRGLGRLNDAYEPMRSGVLAAQHAVDGQLSTQERAEQLKQTATVTSNLSDLEMTLGQLSIAIDSAEIALRYATRSNDNFQLSARHAVFADILNHLGRSDDARLHFVEAERLQAEFQLASPLLYAVRGFRYCEFLLASPERCCWQRTIRKHCLEPPSGDALIGEQEIKACSSVTDRATKTLEWTINLYKLGPLDKAVNYLTLARSRLYGLVLSNWTSAQLSECQGYLEQALEGYRLANEMTHIPRALLTRAWLRQLQGNAVGIDSAQTDLDEAWDISERGPMPLNMADIHLHRARLFMCDTHYPWNKNEDGTQRGPADDLHEARRLIEKHGYWRRKEELQDAEEALRQWQTKSAANVINQSGAP